MDVLRLDRDVIFELRAIWAKMGACPRANDCATTFDWDVKLLGYRGEIRGREGIVVSGGF